MKIPILAPALLSLAVAFLSPVVHAEETADAKREAQLKKWLQRFPEADTNQDGTLTMEEARAFRQTMTSDRENAKAKAKANRLAPTHADVSYGDHERNVFDLWLPERSEKPTPVHVYFHGGGFVGGDKAGFDAFPFLESGIAAVSGNYRFVDGVTTFSPTPMHDAARVIQTLRHRAEEWNLDPDNISVSGNSAGAVIAMWLGFHDDLADPDSDEPVARQSTRVRCIAPTNGPTNLDPDWIRANLGGPHHVHGSLPKMFGGEQSDPAEVARRIEASNPWDHLSEDDPPTLLIYGGKLEPMPLPETVSTGHLIHHPQFGVALKERLDALEIPNELHTAKDPRGTRFLVDWLTKQYR